VSLFAVAVAIFFFGINFQVVILEMLKTSTYMELGRLGKAIRSLCMHYKLKTVSKEYCNILARERYSFIKTKLSDMLRLL
jgi:hypothetical protein